MKYTTQNDNLKARCEYEFCKICKVWKTIWKTFIQICNTANKLQFAAMELALQRFSDVYWALFYRLAPVAVGEAWLPLASYSLVRTVKKH